MPKCNNIRADFVSYLICCGILVVAATIVIACTHFKQFDASPNSKTHATVIKIVALGDSTTDAGWEGNAKEVDGQSIHDLLIRGDDIHPNDVGHALIAEWLADLLLVQLQE